MSLRAFGGLIPENVVRATTNAITGKTEIVDGAQPIFLPGVGKAGVDGILTKYGRVLDRLTDPTQTIGVTTATHVLSNEYPRFGAYTRKMTVTAATQSELRFVSRSITPDADDVCISIDIYVEQIPDPDIASPNNPRISFVLSNTTSAGSNFRQYIFDQSGIRQGWNTFKFAASDTNNSRSAGTGSMPYGGTFSDTGTGLDWNSAIQYVSVQVTKWNGCILHIDDVRQPARAKPILIIGYDANMEIMETHVAPMFAQYGIKSYTTFTKVYEEESAQTGGESGPWARMKRLQEDWGWDIINHTWSHGGTEVGGIRACTLTRATNVVTVTIGYAHGIPLNTTFKALISDATTADLNGLFDIYATSTTQLKYTAAGADVAVAENAYLKTMLAHVFATDTAENRRLLSREILGCTQLMAASGANRQNGAIIWPNNSAPHIDMVEDICHEAGIYVGRGARYGNTPVNEFGPVNPLHCGSWDMDSGASSYTRLSYMKTRVQMAIDRGEHIWIYGHYVQLWADAGGPIVDVDAPPGINGNPAPPAGALSGAGGWWYYEMLEDLIRTTIAPSLASGDMLTMTPSEYAQYCSLIPR